MMNFYFADVNENCPYFPILYDMPTFLGITIKITRFSSYS